MLPLGKLLQLMHTHLPADICNTSSALPTLISYATQGNPQASAAISALQNLHQIFKNRPAACSLFLDTIIQSGGKFICRHSATHINSIRLRIYLPRYAYCEPIIHNFRIFMNVD